jgi:tryptophanyl-tRNA synthetase
MPTYKEQIENLRDRDLGTYGFLGYPLLQAADIVMYGEPKLDLLVPVGEDQAPHVELTREIVRRFNSQFGFEIDEDLFDEENKPHLRNETILSIIGGELVAPKGQPYSDEQKSRIKSIFLNQAREIGVKNFFDWLQPKTLKKFFRTEEALREPAYLPTETPRLPGLDGRRMAKSYGNAVWLSDPPDEIRAKVRNMLTDPQRVRRTDPGRPEICPVFAWHKLFSASETIAKVDRDCRSAALGCVDCKKLMAENLVTWIEPIQARRKEFEAQPKKVWDILDAGSKAAAKAAKRTMKRVRNAVFHADEARGK